MSRRSVPVPEEPGPFAVGVRSTTIDAATRDGRRITIDVWYPVAPGDVPADATPARYDFLPTVRPPARLAFGAELAPAPGVFPVVVYSHGRGPGLLDIETALRLTNRYAVAFLLRWVAGNTDSGEWLAPMEEPEDARVVSLRVLPETPQAHPPG